MPSKNIHEIKESQVKPDLTTDKDPKHGSAAAAPAPIKQDEYITLDLQNVLIPAAILVSTVIISVILVLGIRNLRSSITSSRDTILQAIGASGKTTTTTTPTPTPTATGSTSVGTAPYLGDRATARLAIVEFSDYECPFCIRHAQQTFDQLIATYIDTGEAIYVYRDNIAVPSHDPVATEEAMAAKCVQRIAGNSAYFTFHDLILANTPGNGQGKKSDLYIYAREMGIDSTAFSQCLDGEVTKAAVTADIAAASDAGMSGTPGFIVGRLNSDGTVEGDIIRGAYPFDTFKTTLEKYQ